MASRGVDVRVENQLVRFVQLCLNSCLYLEKDWGCWFLCVVILITTAGKEHRKLFFSLLYSKCKFFFT